MGFSKPVKFGLCAGFLVLTALLATVPAFQIVQRNYTTLDNTSVTGATYGLLESCQTKDAGKTALTTMFTSQEPTTKLVCNGNWEMDNNPINRIGDTFSDVIGDPTVDDMTTVRALGWTAVGFYGVTALLSLIIGLMSLFEKTLVWVPTLTAVDFVGVCVAFVMTVIAIVSRAERKDLHSAAISAVTWSNKTYAPDTGAFTGCFAMLVAIIMLVLVFVVRARLIRRDIAKKAEVRYY